LEEGKGRGKGGDRDYLLRVQGREGQKGLERQRGGKKREQTLKRARRSSSASVRRQEEKRAPRAADINSANQEKKVTYPTEERGQPRSSWPKVKKKEKGKKGEGDEGEDGPPISFRPQKKQAEGSAGEGGERAAQAGMCVDPKQKKRHTRVKLYSEKRAAKEKRKKQTRGWRFTEQTKGRREPAKHAWVMGKNKNWKERKKAGTSSNLSNEKKESRFPGVFISEQRSTQTEFKAPERDGERGGPTKKEGREKQEGRRRSLRLHLKNEKKGEGRKAVGQLRREIVSKSL